MPAKLQRFLLFRTRTTFTQHAVTAK